MRNFVDIRFCALLIGGTQLLWSIVPLIDLKDVSLFARTLGELKYEDTWIAVGMGVGLSTVIGALFKLRAMLLWGLAFSTFSWLAWFAPFLWKKVITPVTFAMPLFALVSFALLVREVMLGQKRYREQRRIRSHVDALEA